MTRGLKIVGALCAVSFAVFITAFAFDPREKTPDEIVNGEDAADTTRTQEDQKGCALDANVIITKLALQDTAWSVCGRNWHPVEIHGLVTALSDEEFHTAAMAICSPRMLDEPFTPSSACNYAFSLRIREEQPCDCNGYRCDMSACSCMERAPVSAIGGTRGMVRDGT
ncbi:MAG: hypothetical protein Q7S02_03505 [bacterium]|nr:hypothetical protein [bacterium]